MKVACFFFLSFLIYHYSNLYCQWQTYQTPTNLTYYDVCVVNQNVIWACGIGGNVRKTTNAGSTWDNTSGMLPSFIAYHISAVDGNRAWITGSTSQGIGERVFRTTNGGINWTEQFYSNPFWIGGIHFFNSNTGVFLRDPPDISHGHDTCGFFITRNGGLNWYSNSYNLETDFLKDNDLKILDSNFVYFMDCSYLFKLIGGLDNAWQIIPLDTNFKTCNHISIFKNTNFGLSTDGFNIFKTTNGGINWTVQNSAETGGSFVDLILVPNTDWVLTNSFSRVNISFDLCSSWSFQTSYPAYDSVSLQYMDAYDTNSIWLAVNKGRLFKYNFDYIGVTNNHGNVPAQFILYQNYPNPFNPITTIKYDIPFESEVLFAVYDFLGKNVYSAHEFKKAGTYVIEFNGQNFSSGIYLYRIECGKFSEAKKMILIK